MPIRKLPPLLVNQIAAGEVIERPASVVKELVENSLDAGATRIDILIEDGGRQLIRISDNGAGIPADELPLAVAPHATSKLQSPDQLASIATLGFRGEALASIASVSRLRLSSRATTNGKTADSGAVIESAGPDVSAVAPAAMAPGTVVEVRDLFFNTPARRKFLRAAPSEFGHIDEVISRIALVHPHVGFTITHNARKTLELSPVDDHHQRCVEILGKDLDQALLEFTHILPAALLDLPQTPSPQRETSIWGLAGLPSIARATAKFQYLCVNGRPIRDRSLAHAVKEAYRGLVPPDQQPVAVVFIHLPPELVDVNVHPAKAEVRFRDPQRIHGLVYTAIRQRLLAADLTPQASIHSSAPAFTPVFEPPPAPTASDANQSEISNLRSEISSSAFVDYFRRMAPQQKGFIYQQVKETLQSEGTLPPDPLPLAAGDPQSAINNPGLKSLSILQVHKSYVVTQDEQGIVIVDQHALHERVMFEELLSRVSGRSLESQRMLMPAVFNVSPRRLALLDQLRPLLDRIGIEISPIGPSAVAVQAFPTFLFDRKVEPIEFLTDLLDRAEEGQFETAKSTNEEAVLHEVLDMMACKAAIKAGDQMTPDELSALLAKRGEIERSSNCPHGRPTTIRLSIRELEKQFKRT